MAVFGDLGVLVGLTVGAADILIRPLSASDYSLFTKSFGLSGKLDRPNGENKANGIGWADELGENPCNAFSKSLIVRAIERPLPPLKRRGVPRAT